MKFDDLGLPRDSNATDFNDSARLAGIMTLFGWPQYIDLTRYIIFMPNATKYVRHPRSSGPDFSRDQALPLMAGFYTEGYYLFVNSKFIDGKDWFSPSHNNHIRICQKNKPTLLGNLWLWIDVMWSCFIDPMAETNQLICMLYIHPDVKYLSFWTRHNKKWKESLRDYWYMNEGSWRQEKDLCEHIILKIDDKLSK